MNENIVYSNIQTKGCIYPTTGYKAQINGVDASNNVVETLCCLSSPDKQCSGAGSNQEFGRSTTIYNFRCENGIVKCNWTTSCFTADTQLTTHEGTATVQFSNGGVIPTGLTDIVTTSSFDFTQDCPITDSSLCSTNTISQVTFVSM